MVKFLGWETAAAIWEYGTEGGWGDLKRVWRQDFQELFDSIFANYQTYRGKQENCIHGKYVRIFSKLVDQEEFWGIVAMWMCRVDYGCWKREEMRNLCLIMILIQTLSQPYSTKYCDYRSAQCLNICISKQLWAGTQLGIQ